MLCFLQPHNGKSQKTFCGVLTGITNYPPFLANLFRASNELRGNKATQAVSRPSDCSAATISLNVFLLLCLFDLRSPTELSTGLQEMVWDKQSKSLCFLHGLG